jgi:hypothetical protein
MLNHQTKAQNTAHYATFFALQSSKEAHKSIKKDLPNCEQVPFVNYQSVKFTPPQLPGRRLTDVDYQRLTDLV